MRGGRSSNTPLNDFDPDPERSFHARLRETQEIRRQVMGDRDTQMEALQQTIAEMRAQLQGLQAERLEAVRRAEIERAQQPPQPTTLGEYMMPASRGPISGVVFPQVTAHHFELKSGLINMIQANQFGGLPSENPHQHIETFLELMHTVKIHNVPNEAIRLLAFHFSLTGKAKTWYRSLPTNSITTWDELYAAFMAKFFPPKKTAEMRAQISSFAMIPGETYFEA
jgi:hypothetical protein